MPIAIDLKKDAARPIRGAGTLPALLARAIEANPTRIAIKARRSSGDVLITYYELQRHVARIGAGLVSRGLEGGDRVALLAENGPDWPLVYAAALCAGGVIVPLDPQLKGNEIIHLLHHCEARYLFISSDLYHERLGGMAPQGIEPILIRSYGNGNGGLRGDGSDGRHGDERAAASAENISGVLSLDDLAAAGKDVDRTTKELSRRAASVASDDVASICYTSGTTGHPKGVVLLHRNLAANVESCAARIPFRSDDVFLCILPLHHAMTTTCSMLAPLAVGACIYFGRSLKSRDIREDIEREGVTVMVGVPLLFEHMAKSLEKRLGELPAPARLLFRLSRPAVEAASRVTGRNVARAVFRRKLEAGGLASLRFCISGAAALRCDVEDTFRSVGLTLLQGYGMTEASPVISVNPPEAPRRGTIGPPLPGVVVKLGEPNAEGIGEILVRGENVMRGYYKDPDATRDVLADGWLATGDLGTIDSRGYITFVGRKKSVIVPAGGKNVYPDELESLLNESPFIVESIVVPARDRKGNEQVAAIVVPDIDAISAAPECGGASEESVQRIIGAEIKRVCDGLPEHKRIRDFRIRSEELPKTTTRKVKRHLVMWPE